jgi:hypothetical protein
MSLLLLAETLHMACSDRQTVLAMLPIQINTMPAAATDLEVLQA